MATGKPAMRRGGGAHRLVWGLVALVALAGLVGLALLRAPLVSRAQAGTAYGARLGCSCRFVAGRPLKACIADFEPGMGMVRLSEDVAARSVTARVPLLASETARFAPGSGCRLDPWTR